MKIWPNNVWERGDIDKNGKQLWYSRAVTPADRVRRLAYEANVRELHEKRASK